MDTPPRHHRLRYLIGGDFCDLAWTEWGPADGAPVVCVHGLTRNGRDFDVLAAALAARGRRVLCPDLPGRGASAWLAQPALYVPPSYVQALSHLIARLDGPVDFVGTSLGGICGMLIAAAEHAPLRRFVLNDIGSSVPGEAIARISAYVRTPLAFDSLAALEAHLRECDAPFGALSDANGRTWRTLHRVLPDGRFGSLDPAIPCPSWRASGDGRFAGLGQGSRPGAADPRRGEDVCRPRSPTHAARRTSNSGKCRASARSR